MTTAKSVPEAHRNTIYEEKAEIIVNAAKQGGQFILRLSAPRIAGNAEPGQFVHVRVSEKRLMRRPISIMSVNPEQGRLDLLIKVVGKGTKELSQRKSGEALSLLGPVGHPFDLSDLSRRYICIGGGVGIPPMIFAAQALREKSDIVLFAGSETAFPFALKPSGLLLPGIIGNTILGISTLEEWGIPSRLASNSDFYGCHKGFVTDLGAAYLEALNSSERKRCMILACGPRAMLQATARLARNFDIPAQLSLEEYMACGVGGCAGCVVRTIENGREHYRRVCVDGPVFPAEILPEFQ